MVSLSTTNGALQLGDVAALLRLLRSRTYLTIDELRDYMDGRGNDSVLFDDLLGYVDDSGLVESVGNNVALTGKGLEWLDSNGEDLGVEEENLGSDGRPTRPYAVAKLKLETRNISVFQALRKIEKNEIDLNPDFQRAFVWDHVKQSRLIESILIRIPLPAFYLDATDQVNWSVVDGLQRLTTLWRYCRADPFPLKGLQFLQELEGSTFDRLPPKYQVLIEDDTQLLFYNLMPGTPVEAKFTIFSRVNTGGMQLTSQEIRHALNQGPITLLLANLASSVEFRSATQGVLESLRMSDRELILRALAFMQFGVDSYKEFNELDAFLLSAMGRMNQLPRRELDRLSLIFLASLSKVEMVFGRYAFRKFTSLGGRRSPFNKALFETWVTAVTPYSRESLERNRAKITASFARLIEGSPAFVRSVSSSTASFSAVRLRFNSIDDLLRECAGD